MIEHTCIYLDNMVWVTAGLSTGLIIGLLTGLHLFIHKYGGKE